MAAGDYRVARHPRTIRPVTADSHDDLGDYAAPTALPSVLARVTAFASIIIGAVCGGLVGFAGTELQCTDGCEGYAVGAGVLGALIAAAGVATIAVLVLRAMAEWEDQASVRDR